MSDSDNEAPVEPPSKIINGSHIAAQIRLEIAHAVKELAVESAPFGEPVVPGLAVILVGDRADSATYVRMKKKACLQVGVLDLSPPPMPATATQAEVLACVAALNLNPRVHGILVQLPLPAHVDEQAVLAAVAVRKDVDGLHPLNLAQLATTQTHQNPALGEGQGFASPLAADPVWSSVGFPVACTPLGCVELLDRSGVTLRGAKACVVGRSNMVGVPLALLLMQRDATVTVVHSHTVDPAAVCREADVVVVAVGKPELVTGSWLKEGAVVIDVGINSVPDTRPANPKAAPLLALNPAAAAAAQAAAAAKGPRMRLVGDVHFQSAHAKAAMITPVPGGVGPMTIAMLLRNTLQAARRFANARADRLPGWGPFENEPVEAPAEGIPATPDRSSPAALQAAPEPADDAPAEVPSAAAAQEAAFADPLSPLTAV